MKEADKTKPEAKAEDKIVKVNRSLAIKVSEIFDKFIKQYERESTTGKLVINSHNLMINALMQTEIDKQIEIHMEVIDDILGGAMIREAIAAIIKVKGA